MLVQSSAFEEQAARQQQPLLYYIYYVIFSGGSMFSELLKQHAERRKKTRQTIDNAKAIAASSMQNVGKSLESSANPFIEVLSSNHRFIDANIDNISQDFFGVQSQSELWSKNFKKFLEDIEHLGSIHDWAEWMELELRSLRSEIEHVAARQDRPGTTAGSLCDNHRRHVFLHETQDDNRMSSLTKNVYQHESAERHNIQETGTDYRNGLGFAGIEEEQAPLANIIKATSEEGSYSRTESREETKTSNIAEYNSDTCHRNTTTLLVGGHGDGSSRMEVDHSHHHEPQQSNISISNVIEL